MTPDLFPQPWWINNLLDEGFIRQKAQELQAQPLPYALADWLRQHFCAPTLAQACHELIGKGATQITVVPMFLGTGKHAREDLPVLIHALREQHPRVQFKAQPAIGEDLRLTTLMAEIACEGPFH